MRKIVLYLLIILNIIFLASCGDKPIDKILFSSLELPTSITSGDIAEFKLSEETVGLVKSKYNPFKESSISADLVITNSLGESKTRPFYWTQDYKISYFNGVDSAFKQGDEYFCANFRPSKAGEYTYKVNVYVAGELKEEQSGSFSVLASSVEYKGKIVVNDSNKRYFMYENTRDTFIPIGFNTAWYSRSVYESNRGSFDYDVWFNKMRSVGCNMGRIWMASWSFGLHIGQGAKLDDYTNRLAYAERLDRVLALAESKGIYVLLTLNNHGQFSKTTDSEFSNNPYNQIINSGSEFFYNELAKQTYKDELRYIVARYGSYDSVLAWELFNEVDWTDYASINDKSIKNWHQEMASYINSLDCYDRMITTSYKGNGGSASYLDEIDISCIHSYAYSYNNAISYTKTEITQNYANFKKLVLFAEWGLSASSGGDTYTLDPTGIATYQSMWSSLLQGGAGSTMSWWWDSYIEKYNLFSIYKGIASYSKKMDMNGSVSYLTGFGSLPTNLSSIGVKCDDRYYLYLYDSAYTYKSSTVRSFSGSVSFDIEEGSYSVEVINPHTGSTIKTINVTSNGTLTFELDSFDTDIALIIKK